MGTTTTLVRASIRIAVVGLLAIGSMALTSTSANAGTPRSVGEANFGELAAISCVGKAATILKESDGSHTYLHFGGIQQCSSPVDQHLTVMLDRWSSSTAKWVPVRRAYRSAVGWTVTAYGEPNCSRSTSTRYRQRVYGGAAGGIIATPYPYISSPVTKSCYVTIDL